MENAELGYDSPAVTLEKAQRRAAQQEIDDRSEATVPHMRRRGLMGGGDLTVPDPGATPASPPGVGPVVGKAGADQHDTQLRSEAPFSVMLLPENDSIYGSFLPPGLSRNNGANAEVDAAQKEENLATSALPSRISATPNTASGSVSYQRPDGKWVLYAGSGDSKETRDLASDDAYNTFKDMPNRAASARAFGSGRSAIPEYPIARDETRPGFGPTPGFKPTESQLARDMNSRGGVVQADAASLGNEQRGGLDEALAERTKLGAAASLGSLLARDPLAREHAGTESAMALEQFKGETRRAGGEQIFNQLQRDQAIVTEKERELGDLMLTPEYKAAPPELQEQAVANLKEKINAAKARLRLRTQSYGIATGETNPEMFKPPVE